MRRARHLVQVQEDASMGPRLDNRGYASGWPPAEALTESLQWVHGWITVVMSTHRRAACRPLRASMGPRLDNRGYVALLCKVATRTVELQWVHGWITVVMEA